MSRTPIAQSVTKWVARDGSLHDSALSAEEYTLRSELAQAISVGDGSPAGAAKSAAQVLVHFEVWRRGDPLPERFESAPVAVPTPSIRFLFWSFFAGATIATTIMLYLFR